MKSIRTITATWLVLSAAAWAGPNLLKNPGFESSVTPQDWCITWGSFAAEPFDGAPDGNSAGFIKGSWAGSGDNGGCVQRVQAAPGIDYEVSGMFYVKDGWTAAQRALKIEFFDASHNLLSARMSDLNSLSEGKWYVHTVSAESPAGTDHIQVVVEASGVGGTGVLGFDDLTLKVKTSTRPVPTAFPPSAREPSHRSLFPARKDK
ncbi:MAG: hypothetical protein V1873_08810 [Verrucomicrobiota bacterium]